MAWNGPNSNFFFRSVGGRIECALNLNTDSSRPHCELIKTTWLFELEVEFFFLKKSAKKEGVEDGQHVDYKG